MKLRKYAENNSRTSILKFINTLFVLMLMFCFLFPSTAMYAADPENIVRVGWFIHPGVQEANNGVYSGYTYDYLMKIAKYTGWTYEFVETDFATCLQMLKEGKLDIVGNLLLSDERMKVYDFPQYEYGHSYITLFTSQNSNIKA